MSQLNDECISVIGLGYIGLPTAAVLASVGHTVTGVDKNRSVVDCVNNGNIHIVEPGLEQLVADVIKSGDLRASVTIPSANVFIIAVPTPLLHSDKIIDKEPDLSFVKLATKEIGKVLKKGDLIILESTSPVGTTEEIAEILRLQRPDLQVPFFGGNVGDISIAYCPERVLPGKTLEELVTNDRLIGGLTKSCADAATCLYKTFVKGECVATDARTAELAKLTENAYRDTSIAFANELSLICDQLGVDVWELIAAANRHPRVNILQPGPGVGGHCIAVDPWFIVHSAPEASRLIKTARVVNDEKPFVVIEQLGRELERLAEKQNTTLTSSDIAVYGLTFKANIDDVRESPALQIATIICEKYGDGLRVVEPNLEVMPAELANKAVFASYEDAQSAAIHILLVDHEEFYAADAPGGVLIDTRGVWS